MQLYDHARSPSHLMNQGTILNPGGSTPSKQLERQFRCYWRVVRMMKGDSLYEKFVVDNIKSFGPGAMGNINHSAKQVIALEDIHNNFFCERLVKLITTDTYSTGQPPYWGFTTDKVTVNRTTVAPLIILFKIEGIMTYVCIGK